MHCATPQPLGKAASAPAQGGPTGDKPVAGARRRRRPGRPSIRGATRPVSARSHGCELMHCPGCGETGKPGRDGAPSPVNPRHSATKQEVRFGGLPTMPRWGGYHLAPPGGPPGRKGVYYPQNQTSNLKPELMQKQLVLVEYGEPWYGTGQRCLMRSAGRGTQPGVETDRGWSRTPGADKELRCPLEAQGLRGSLLLSCTPWAVHSCPPRVAWVDQPPALGVADTIISSSDSSTSRTLTPPLAVNLWRPGWGESRGTRA